VFFFGIQDDGKSPETFCEFCTTYTIVRILSSLSVHQTVSTSSTYNGDESWKLKLYMHIKMCKGDVTGRGGP
jgi:hypothetical protein